MFVVRMCMLSWFYEFRMYALFMFYVYIDICSGTLSIMYKGTWSVCLSCSVHFLQTPLRKKRRDRPTFYRHVAVVLYV